VNCAEGKGNLAKKDRKEGLKSSGQGNTRGKPKRHAMIERRVATRTPENGVDKNLELCHSLCRLNTRQGLPKR